MRRQSFRARPPPLLSIFSLFLLVLVATATTTHAQEHTENYAVIVSSSRYWFNYRHAVNALTMYRILKEQGNFTDDRIILMLADEYAINPRNPYKNFMTSSSSTISSTSISLYKGDDIEIDYRGEDVTVENLARVLSGKAPPGSILPVIPADTPTANIFLYLTGHGGDSFFKFQDVEEIMAADLAALLRQRSFHRALFIADTCQAFTLGDQMEDMANANNRVIMIGSSLRDESSYAHHSNTDLGLASIERYTFALDQFISGNNNMKNTNWQTIGIYDALVAPYSYESQRAHIGIRPPSIQTDNATGIVLADFFVNKASQQHQGAATLTMAQPWSTKNFWKTNAASNEIIPRRPRIH